tara:strand:+ start:278 stop:505 length:228 start_codon:yes stop_codon:yes gene_type:complete
VKFLHLPFGDSEKKDALKKSRSKGSRMNYTRPTHRDKREVPKVEISERIETPKTTKPVKETPRKSLKERYMERRE